MKTASETNVQSTKALISGSTLPPLDAVYSPVRDSILSVLVRMQLADSETERLSNMEQLQEQKLEELAIEADLIKEEKQLTAISATDATTSSNLSIPSVPTQDLNTQQRISQLEAEIKSESRSNYFCITV